MRKEPEMGLNHPSLAHRVLDLERDRLLARAAADRRAEGLGPDPGKTRLRG